MSLAVRNPFEVVKQRAQAYTHMNSLQALRYTLVQEVQLWTKTSKICSRRYLDLHTANSNTFLQNVWSYRSPPPPHPLPGNSNPFCRGSIDNFWNSTLCVVFQTAWLSNKLCRKSFSQIWPGRIGLVSKEFSVQGSWFRLFVVICLCLTFPSYPPFKCF